jgi:hypothetical protein
MTICNSSLGSDVDAAAAALAARSRLAAAAQQRERSEPREPYYGIENRHEEVLRDILSAGRVAGVVTRNHYGSLVLNAASALFIDVDVSPPAPFSTSAHGRGEAFEARYRRVLDDLRVVLASERRTGFRIYRTRAGFRILGTTHEFLPGSHESERLMNLVGADAAFVDLCRIQNSFRARLSPKPWRCGARRPPHAFPRQSAHEQRRFADWLSQYEHVCRGRATCQYLGRIGPEDTHEGIRQVIEFHDCETRAYEPLPLA